MEIGFWINLGLILLFSGGFMLIPCKKHLKKCGIILLILCLCVEIFAFNFHSFHLWFRDYTEKTLSTENASISSDTLENVTSTVITFQKIDQRIGTVFIDCTLADALYAQGDKIVNKKTHFVNVKIDAKDETYSSDYRYGTANGVIINGNERSQTIVLNMSGKVSDLRISLNSDTDRPFTVNEIKINTPVPMTLSALRFILIFCLLFVILLLFHSETLQKTIEEKSKVYAYTAVSITAVMLMTAILITVLYNLNNSSIPFNNLKQTSGNQISQELVDAFENGQVSLLDTPSDKLLEMENPYDWGARSKEGVSYKWDHLLFDGKYYSYYGIAPVFLLFLPYHLITGYYFPTPEAVLLFGMIGIAFLSMLFYEFSKKLFPKLPLNIAISSLIVLQASSGIWYCFASPLFYEIAQASGFAFTCAGFYFLIKSNVITQGDIKKRHLVFSSFCLSCAVLCRPTLAVYCIAALIFIAAGFIKHKEKALKENLSVARSALGYFTSALACFVVIGSLQMIYNYVRFGSFFDFGIQYSLTINDFTRAEYHTDFVFIGFWNYLFASPFVKPEFPFIFSNFSTLDTNGYYFIANRNAIGIFYRALPALGLFLAPFAFRSADKKKRIIPSILLTAVCIICPAVIIFSIWESGYGVRYAADFSWQIILGGIIVIYFLFEKYKLYSNKFANRFITVFFVYSALTALFANSALLYDYMSKSGYIQSAFMSFERLFEFWI